MAHFLKTASKLGWFIFYTFFLFEIYINAIKVFKYKFVSNYRNGLYLLLVTFPPRSQHDCTVSPAASRRRRPTDATVSDRRDVHGAMSFIVVCLLFWKKTALIASLQYCLRFQDL